jgi:cytochrome P450
MPIIDYYLTKHPILTKIFKIKSPYVTEALKLLESRLEVDEQLKEEDKKDLISQFLAAKGKHESVTDDVIVGYVMTMLMAGSDTTSVALRTVVYHLAKHDNVRRRLQQELDEANLQFPVPWKDIQNLAYLDAVIKEALRVYPIGAILQERVVPLTGFELPDGRRIPPGTIVGVAGFNTNRRPEVWGDNPEEFNPSRWFQLEKETTEAFTKRLNGMKRFDISFGHGPRGCLGKNIAILEMYKATATLFGMFDVSASLFLLTAGVRTGN